MTSGIRIRGVAASGQNFNRELPFDDDAKFREDIHRIAMYTNDNWRNLTPAQEVDWVLELVRRYLKNLVANQRAEEKAAARRAEDEAEEENTFPPTPAAQERIKAMSIPKLPVGVQMKKARGTKRVARTVKKKEDK